MEDSSSNPGISKHAKKITLEEKGGDVIDKLVKDPSDLGGWLQGCLRWVIPIWKPCFLVWCAEDRRCMMFLDWTLGTKGWVK